MSARIKIQISEEDILILKSYMLLKPSHIEKIRADVADQVKNGVVTIPNGFEYEIYTKRQKNWRESMMRDFLQESER